MVRAAATTLVACVALPIGLALAGGYGGALHPMGDSLAVFRAHLAALLAGSGLLFLVLRAWPGTFLALGFSAVAGLPIAWAGFAPIDPPAAPDVTIYTKNVLGRWGDQAAIAEDIRSSGADIVLLQELSISRGTIPEALSETHPHQHVCAFSDRSGMAVLSRWPLDAPYCSPIRSIAAARIAAPFGEVWAVSTHLVWPYPYDQRPALDRAMPFLDDLDGAIVVAGDFNMTPWGHSVARIAEATGTEVLGPLHTTIEVRRVPLTIDHVLTTGAGMVERRPRLGSDHFGLLARIDLAP